MVKLHYFGHACFMFEDNNNLFLMDPWLSMDGAFLGSWRQMDVPKNSVEIIIKLSKIKKLNVLISHEHEDHYDFSTLNQLKEFTHQIIIPKYQGRYFYNKLKKNINSSIFELQENQSLIINDTSIQFFIDESGINRDAGFHIKNKDLNFLNLNDCKLNDRASFIKNKCGKIDIFTCQFSGANMHPHAYNFNKETIANIANKKIKKKFFAVKKLINNLSPEIYIPSAGPPLFSPKELEMCNEDKDTIFPKWWNFKKYIEKNEFKFNFLNLKNNTYLNFKNHKLISEPILSKEMSKTIIANNIKFYRNIENNKKYKKYSSIEISNFIKTEFEKKLIILRKFKEKLEMNFSFYFYLDGEFVFGFNNKELKLLKQYDNPKDYYYIHHANSNTINKLMNSKSSWGTYFLSLMFKNERVPDVYDSLLNLFLVSNTDEELQYGLENEELEIGLNKLKSIKDNNELIELKSLDGKSKVICQRYCPHQGADLKFAEFDGHYITCPRHSWMFDAKNNGLSQNSKDKLFIKSLKKINH